MITKQEQAKNGFKTFIITLSVSLVVFSSIYYLLGNFTDKVNIDEFKVNDKVALNEENVKGTSSKKLANNSPFGDLNATAPQVLAETDTTTTTTTTTTTNETQESTESTVPETGSTTLVGSILSVGFFSIAVAIILSGPRKAALSKFEDSALKD